MHTSVMAIAIAAVILCLLAVAWQMMPLMRKNSHSNQAATSADLTLRRPVSPLLSVSFSDALNTSALGNSLGQYATDRMSYQLGIDPVNLVIQSVSLAKDQRSLHIAYEFTKRGMRLYKSGEAVIPMAKDAGGALPILSDSGTGRFIEMAKGRRIDPAKFAQISSIVVSVAHVISGLDVVRRLDVLDRNMDLLIAGREIDQKAKLESIYQMAKERLSGSISSRDQEDLLRWRKDLYELRSVWREELEHLIKTSPDLEERKLLKMGSWTQNGRERVASQHMISGAIKLRLTKLAFILDLYLAQETESIDKFVLATVPDEHRLWASIMGNVDSLSSKAKGAEGDSLRLLSATVTGYTNVLESIKARERTTLS
jgi:hypothetical protein